MMNIFSQSYRLVAFATILTLAGLAQAQNMIPDSIQLNDEVAAYSYSATPSAALTQNQVTVTPVQYQEVVTNPAPNVQPLANPATQSQGVPVYTPDGSAPAMEAAPIVEEAATEGPSDSLFLNEFCAPVCQPSRCGLLGPGCLFVEGWVDQGLNVNSNKSAVSNLPMAPNDREGYQLNQVYVSFGRHVIKADQWAIGGQIDVMYGTDYYYMTSTGLETSTENMPHINGQTAESEYRGKRTMYGMALPQFFAEIYAPIMNGVDVKVGHFNSVMGFESNQATQNFFYSRSYQSVYGMPTSMTGVISDWKLSYNWSLIAGAVNEWNTFSTGHDYFSFVGGATYSNTCGNFELSALVMTGKQRAACFQPDGIPNSAYDTTLFNLIAKYKFTERLAYVAEFTYGHNNAVVKEIDDLGEEKEFKGRNWYGFSNYLFYCMSDHLTLGARFEWFHDKENTVLNGAPRETLSSVPANYFCWSFGANWEPLTWLTVRPELRWDYSDLEIESKASKGFAYDDGNSKYQFTVGCDAIVKF